MELEWQEKWKTFTANSRKICEEAMKHLATPTSASFRRLIGFPNPVCMVRAKGCKMWDVDGHEYIDYYLGGGPLILGHGHPKVIEAIKNHLDEVGTTYFSAMGEYEMNLAKEIKKRYKYVDLVRFTDSGMIANVVALRISRGYSKRDKFGYTARDKFGRFEGQYHGSNEWLYPGTFVGPLTLSPGIPKSVMNDIIVLPWGDLSACEKIVKRHENELSSILMCPALQQLIVDKEFLKGIREITEESDIILIFDEVATGFRVPPEYWGVTPDLVTLGKIIGGGLPIGAVCGKKEFMQLLSDSDPIRTVPHSGTFSGHDLAMVAGLATLKELDEIAYSYLDRITDKLVKGMAEIFEDRKIEYQILRLYSLFDHLFVSPNVKIKDSVDYFQKPDKQKRAKFFRELLYRGVYWVAGQHWIPLSTAHTDKDIEKTLTVIDEVAKTL